jgi:TonB family protein
VDPQYTDQARRAKLNGVCILALVIGVDGIPQNVRVVRKLDPGLDKKAIEAVSKYRFDPATLNGKPVPVEVNIEVAFKIY